MCQIKSILSKHVLWNTLTGVRIGNTDNPPSFHIMSPVGKKSFSVIDKLIWVPLCKLYLKPFGKWKHSHSVYEDGRITDETYICYFN